MGQNSKFLVLPAVVAIAMAMAVSVESGESEAVSPGALERFTGVEGRCPTFSWEAATGAQWYELMVYELPPEFDLATATSLDDAIEVLVVKVPGGALSWTPPLESCLERGADHVWFVRTLFDEEGLDVESSSNWSNGRFFQIAATPSPTEIEDALRVLSAYVESGAEVEVDPDAQVVSGASRDSGRRRPIGSAVRKPGGVELKSVGTATAAIRGEVPDPAGETYGVVGISNSPGGAGFGAVNTAGGPDLVLDAGGLTDTAISESGIDRASPGAESFTIANTGGGTIDLSVQGGVTADSLSGDGSGLTNVDAATFGGVIPGDYAPDPHDHAGELWAGVFTSLPLLDLTNQATSGATSHAVRGATNSQSGSASAVIGTINSPAPGGFSAGVRGVNNGLGGSGIGVWGSQNGSGWGLYGTSVTGYGAFLTTSSAGGRGLYVRGGSGVDADIILGANDSTGSGDDGRIRSDPIYSGSDIFLTSNDGVVVELDADASGEDADFEVRNKDGGLIFNVDESGETSFFSTGGLEYLQVNNDDGEGGGEIFLRNGAGVTTMFIEASEAGSDGAQIILYDIAGVATITLDAEYGVGGDGRITTEVLEITGGSDLSEQFEVSSPYPDVVPGPGMVVSIGGDELGELEVSHRSYDRRVAGVISGAGGVQPGMLMSQKGTAADGHYPVALTGRVYVWVDASYGPVEAGDLMTTSDTPGHAKKVTDHDQAQGAVLGKAMTGLASGLGLVLVLVTLQ